LDAELGWRATHLEHEQLPVSKGNCGGAQIGAFKDHYNLGRFDKKEDAERAHLEAKRRLHPTCTI
jgi:hypothetical protein